MKEISKLFPGVVALDKVNFSVRYGEIHSLMGENGAGKSTLIKILTGVYPKDGGSIVLDGMEVNFLHTLEAQKAGISTVYQELNMIPYLSVAENIFLGRYPVKGVRINWKQLNRDAGFVMESIGLTNIDVRSNLEDLGTATRQMISIARAVSLNCKILVLDEPTSSLDAGEVRRLFKIIDSLKQRGISIIFITHRLSEVFQISDRVTILKDGKFEGTYRTKDLDTHTLVSKMVGREIDENKAGTKQRDSGNTQSTYVVELNHICSLPKVKDVSIRIKKGEIVGLAGLLGSGRTETAQIMFGYARPQKGALILDGEKISLSSPKDGLKNKLAFCTENRREEGIIPNMSVRDNILLSSFRSASSRGFVNRQTAEQIVKKYIDILRIKTPSMKQSVKNLSGGNQQKVILARWLATNPKVIILDEPTRGIDVGAKKEVENIISGLAKEGMGVLLISSEISELINNCDKIYVIRDGAILGEISGINITQENITKMMSQHHKNLERTD